ncbi:low-density lipoprotein receptor-related protein 1B-like isoform X1, partial [Tachysurus ichikawai]
MTSDQNRKGKMSISQLNSNSEVYVVLPLELTDIQNFSDDTQPSDDSSAVLSDWKHCGPDEFQCRNQRCIQLMWRCDGDDDCSDRSDEETQLCSNRSCPPDQFKCQNSRCIPKKWLCDGADDCGNNDDESDLICA